MTARKAMYQIAAHPRQWKKIYLEAMAEIAARFGLVGESLK